MCKIDLEKIKGRISESRTGLNDIAVQGTWNVKYINPACLSDEELLTAVIYAYNTLSGERDIYYPITKSRIRKYLGWSNYKICKIVASIPEVTVTPIWNDEGRLRGKGYVVKSLINN